MARTPDEEVLIYSSVIEEWMDAGNEDLAYVFARKCAHAVRKLRPWLCNDDEYQVPGESIMRWMVSLEQEHAMLFGPPQSGATNMRWEIEAQLLRFVDQIEWLVTHGRRRDAVLLVRCCVNRNIIDTALGIRHGLQARRRAETEERLIETVMRQPVEDDRWKN